MKIAFGSDFHVDHPQLKIEWLAADVIVVAGDIANDIGNTLKVLGKIAKRYARVYYTDGNHEHYSNHPKKTSRRRTVDETRAAIMAQLPENVIYLTHGRPHDEYEGIHFIGVNGWYSCDVETPGVEIDATDMYEKMADYGFNDPKWVGFSPHLDDHPWVRAKADADLVRGALEAITDDKPIVVFTHTAPHRNLVKWSGVEAKDRTNLFYVNTHMTKIIEEYGDRISLWNHGHTHFPRDTRIGNMIALVNPRGYPHNNPHWSLVVIDSNELER
jgi:predicted phosphodiesterase